MKSIESRHNPIVQRFRALAGQPDPSGTRLLLDGAHLLQDARRAGAGIEMVAVAASRLEGDSEIAQLAHALLVEGTEVVAVTDRVLQAMSPVRTPSGIVAIASRRPAGVDAICTHAEAFVVVAADVQDPGNLGSLLRAAEAAGATGSLVTGTSASPFSWKALRGSMGTVLRLPVAAGLTTEAAVGAMRTAGLRTVASVARAGSDPDAIDWRGRVGLLLGGEGPGLPDGIVRQCDVRVTIPMSTDVESLNVAVATGILCYAARRQRTRQSD